MVKIYFLKNLLVVSAKDISTDKFVILFLDSECGGSNNSLFTIIWITPLCINRPQLKIHFALMVYKNLSNSNL